MTETTTVQWVNLIFNCQAAQSEAVESALFEAGAASVTFEDEFDQPIFEPKPGETPLWAIVRVKALFDRTADRAPVHVTLQQHFAVESITEEALPPKDWVREWMDQYEPQCFGDRLWVVPSWLQAPVDDGAIANGEAVIVNLDPGVAFGTGTHPTTAMCLHWIAQSLTTGALKNGRVLDFGCGSGLLAIAALKVGAAHATAVDIDEQAVEATERNGVDNGVEAAIAVGLPDTLNAEDSFDAVLANILAGPLVELAPTLMSHLNPGGHIVLSGLLTEQSAHVQSAYPNVHWLAEHVTDDWVCLVGKAVEPN